MGRVDGSGAGDAAFEDGIVERTGATLLQQEVESLKTEVVLLRTGLDDQDREIEMLKYELGWSTKTRAARAQARIVALVEALREIKISAGRQPQNSNQSAMFANWVEEKAAIALCVRGPADAD